MITRSFMIDEELWVAVKNKATMAGLSISSVIRVLLKMWLTGRVEIQL
jgi:hypothetical protein